MNRQKTGTIRQFFLENLGAVGSNSNNHPHAPLLASSAMQTAWHGSYIGSIGQPIIFL
jgi:hypothetical protein